jgi:galactokinase
MSTKANMPAAAGAAVAKSQVHRFEQLFGVRPQLFRAPGRVNLIGEHTDYNDGFVMPAAIGFYTWVAAAPRNDHKLKVHSEQFSETVEMDIGALAGPPRKHWTDYVRGVAAVLQSAGYDVQGASLLIQGEVPLGAGLSSSAAIEVSTALALTAMSGIEVPRLVLAKLCQRAENEYSGARCGIMDQFISCFGQSDHALMLDCRDLSYKPVPIPQGAKLVICNTMVKHELAGGEYNQRRASCEAGVAFLKQSSPKIRALRDVTLQNLEQNRAALSDGVYRRCRHVISENERVVEAAGALQAGDLRCFGELMYQSHESLDKDYEVSCEELNIMVGLARGIEGVYGARMTGGGFGGCTVNLVRADAVARFQSTVMARYRSATGLDPIVYICSAAQAAGPVPVQ